MSSTETPHRFPIHTKITLKAHCLCTTGLAMSPNGKTPGLATTPIDKRPSLVASPIRKTPCIFLVASFFSMDQPCPLDPGSPCVADQMYMHISRFGYEPCCKLLLRGPTMPSRLAIKIVRVASPPYILEEVFYSFLIDKSPTYTCHVCHNSPLNLVTR